MAKKNEEFVCIACVHCVCSCLQYPDHAPPRPAPPPPPLPPGTQWHPEKPASEFGMEEVPHTLDAVRVSQHIANYFMEMARMSIHKPQSKEEELAMLIYSTPPIFSARFEVLPEDNYDGPDITYYFDTQDKPPHGPDDDEGGDNGTMASARWNYNFRTLGIF